MLKRLTDALGPYAKALVLVVALIAAVLAQTVGIDIGLSPDEAIQALGAAVLVFLVPNRPAE